MSRWFLSAVVAVVVLGSQAGAAPYKSQKYGPGTSKSGPAGQRLRIHKVPYQGSNGGYTPPVASPRKSPAPSNGSAAPTKKYDYYTGPKKK